MHEIQFYGDKCSVYIPGICHYDDMPLEGAIMQIHFNKDIPSEMKNELIMAIRYMKKVVDCMKRYRRTHVL